MRDVLGKNAVPNLRRRQIEDEGQESPLERERSRRNGRTDIDREGEIKYLAHPSHTGSVHVCESGEDVRSLLVRLSRRGQVRSVSGAMRASEDRKREELTESPFLT